MMEAVQALIGTCHEAAKLGHYLAFNISDCGGATLDLQGGTYLISQPLVLPPWIGNLHISGGSIRGSESFPKERWLVELNDTSSTGVAAELGHEDVSFTDIFFDSAGASGGLLVDDGMGCVISQCYFIGFTVAGVKVLGGHEILIEHCWLGEVWWNEPVPVNSSSIGILIDGNDHVITDTIVFAYADIGIEINSPGTLVHNVNLASC